MGQRPEMGIVTRQLAKKKNQEYAAVRRAGTTLGPEQVVAAVELICMENNARIVEEAAELQERWSSGNRFQRWAASKDQTGPPPPEYFVYVEGGHAFVGYLYSLEYAMKCKREGKTYQPRKKHWLAQVDLPPVDAMGGNPTVGVSLMRWTEDDAGKINNADLYEKFLNELTSAIS